MNYFLQKSLEGDCFLNQNIYDFFWLMDFIDIIETISKWVVDLWIINILKLFINFNNSNLFEEIKKNENQINNFLDILNCDLKNLNELLIKSNDLDLINQLKLLIKYLKLFKKIVNQIWVNSIKNLVNQKLLEIISDFDNKIRIAKTHNLFFIKSKKYWFYLWESKTQKRKFFFKENWDILAWPFDSAWDFYYWVARVFFDWKYHYINSNWEYILKDIDYAFDFSDSIWRILNNWKFFYINTKWEIIWWGYSQAQDFKYFYWLIVWENENYYFVDCFWNIKFWPYDYADEFYCWLALCKSWNNYFYIDLNWKIVSKNYLYWTNFSNWVALVRNIQNSQFLLVDLDFNMIYNDSEEFEYLWNWIIKKEKNWNLILINFYTWKTISYSLWDFYRIEIGLIFEWIFKIEFIKFENQDSWNWERRFINYYSSDLSIIMTNIKKWRCFSEWYCFAYDENMKWFIFDKDWKKVYWPILFWWYFNDWLCVVQELDWYFRYINKDLNKIYWPFTWWYAWCWVFDDWVSIIEWWIDLQNPWMKSIRGKRMLISWYKI